MLPVFKRLGGNIGQYLLQTILITENGNRWMNDLINILQSYAAISDEEIEGVANIAEYKRYEKNEYIFTPNTVCNHIFIMTKGLVRCFYLYDDKEINLRLLCEHSAVIAYSSYIQQTKTEEFVQTIESSEGYIISRKHIEKLSETVPVINQLKLQTAERHYISMERRLLTIQYKTAEERLRYFMKVMEPGIVERTPAIHIASYLGMPPESLSRAKRKLNKC